MYRPVRTVLWEVGWPLGGQPPTRFRAAPYGLHTFAVNMHKIKMHNLVIILEKILLTYDEVRGIIYSSKMRSDTGIFCSLFITHLR